jgi:hypothetical protein
MIFTLKMEASYFPQPVVSNQKTNGVIKYYTRKILILKNRFFFLLWGCNV